MERKFVSKLNQLKPAALARKEASTQLKETILSNKYKPVEPIDYDEFIEKNINNLKKDTVKNLILLPDDDIYCELEKYDESVHIKYDNLKTLSTIHLPALINTNTKVYSLFVNDCLNNYSIDKYLIKYRYHNYGGNYKQLPNFIEQKLFLCTEKLVEHNYEIDHEQELKQDSRHSNLNENNKAVKFKRQAPKNIEKQGWLQYKLTTPNDLYPNKNLKKRYFHLHIKNININGHSNDKNSTIYVLDCFKDNKKNELKFSIEFDSNTEFIKSQQIQSFQIINLKNNELVHQFNPDNQKEFEEWLILLNDITENVHLNNSTNTNNTSNTSNSSQNDSPSKDYKLYNDLYAQYSNFDLNKYLKENEEDLLSDGKNDLQINPFSLYQELKHGEPPSEETELECDWPEKSIGRKLLLNCDYFKFGLSFNSKNDEISLNPEPFFITFALYDAISSQKISSNFYWNPNPKYLNDMIHLNARLYNQLDILNNNSSNGTTNGNNIMSSIFTLNGKHLLNTDYETSIFEYTNKCFNKLSKALFTVLDPHEEIYLVARIEKILDGKTYNASLQPYLNNSSSSIANTKQATKLNKKMKFICSKLGAYRMPFAWAAKQVYKKSANFTSSLSSNNTSHTSLYNYEIDESDPVIFQQDVYHLTDEDLFKYLSDFHTRDKYLNKLTQINGRLSLQLQDMKASAANELPNLISSSYNPITDFSSRNNNFILEVDCFDPQISNMNVTSPSIAPSQVAMQQQAPQQTQQNNQSMNSSLSQGPLVSNQAQFTNGTLNNSPVSNEFYQRARLLSVNNHYKNHLYVYPKSLKYELQKTFPKARNIMVLVEFRESDSNSIQTISQPLKCIFNQSYAVNNANELFVKNNVTPILHHNKSPQYYEEIKILLPLNLHEKHHLLFKFYHISCNTAKSLTTSNSSTLPNGASISSMSSVVSTASSLPSNNKNIETNIGFAWLPLFKNGKLFNGEKTLPVAQYLPNNYLNYEPIGFGQSVGPDVKWVDNAKPIFKVNILPLSTIHTSDTHVANFFMQCEKLINSLNTDNGTIKEDNQPDKLNLNSKNKPKAPTISLRLDDTNSVSVDESDVDKENVEPKEIELVLCDTNKEKIKNSVKPIVALTAINYENSLNLIDKSNSFKIKYDRTVSLTSSSYLIWSKPKKEDIALTYCFKALHATDMSTIIKFLPVIINRILKVLTITMSADVAIHAVRALLHFVSEATSVGKLGNLKAFIKYIFHVDYTNMVKSLYLNDNSTSTTNNKQRFNNYRTIHEELISNLVILIRQIQQDNVLMMRILKNCWFFFEITIKSICIYYTTYKTVLNQNNNDTTLLLITSSKLFDDDFYTSLKNLYDLLIDYLIKCVTNIKPQDVELLSACKSCNRSLAMFIKKSLNILNRKFLFNLINKYLENFHPCDNRNLFDIKFEFIRIICNHEHYFPFNLPTTKAISNINDYTDFKSDFILSDQYRKYHYLTGVLLSQLCISLNENKELRKNSIHILRNILCKHSFDPRYRDKFKQARITTLYIPFIDILIENLSRLNLSNYASGQKNSILSDGFSSKPLSINSANSQVISNYSSMANGSIVSSTSAVTLTQQNNHGYESRAASALSQFANESILDSELSSLSKQRKSPAETVLGVIAGIANSFKPDTETLTTISDNESMSSADDKSSFTFFTSDKQRTSIAVSDNTEVSKSYCVIRKDKLENSEVKDLLICAVYILKHISQDALLGLWCNYCEYEFIEFLNLLELCLTTFRYRGKHYIEKLNAISKGQDVKALIRSPRTMGDPISYKKESIIHKMNNHENSINTVSQDELTERILIESSLCHEVGITVLNILSLFIGHYKDKLIDPYGTNSITRRLFDIYFYLLQADQSEKIKLKVFASFRILINKVPNIFLDGQSTICSSLCYELLKCFNSHLQSLRLEACTVLYLLMRKNYEFTKHKGIVRVHLQTIISVSQLIGTIKITNNVEFQECLAILNAFSHNDQTLANTNFSLEVKDLTKRIKNILTATSQLKDYKNDPETLTDLQYLLAKSYTNTPELRRTWLENMAKINEKEKYYAEAGQCYLHISALIAENLKYQGLYPHGCVVFRKFAPNIESEESNRKTDDLGDFNEIQYTEKQFLDYLCKSADMFKLADRLEALPDIFKLSIGIYERNRDYEHLQEMHNAIQKTYSSLSDKEQYKEKPLGSYYLVRFYGKGFEDENIKAYIYREPAGTKLCEICERLRKLYAKRFGPDNLEIINDSRKLNEIKSDETNMNYIHVTYVQPYFEDNELLERSTYYERNTNIKKFFYEVPFHLKAENKTDETNKSQHQDILKLCKKKTILQTSHWFPYVKKRILVVYEKTKELNPLETAIDELKQKSEEFAQIIRKKDLTLLDLVLQGSIIPQVHKGPLALAEAFLDQNESIKYNNDLMKDFKNAFRRLIELIKQGIDLYSKLTAHLNEKADEGNTSKNSNNAAKQLDIHQLLQQRFHEIENKFKGLLTEGDLKFSSLSHRSPLFDSNKYLNIEITLASSEA